MGRTCHWATEESDNQALHLERNKGRIREQDYDPVGSPGGNIPIEELDIGGKINYNRRRDEESWR